MRTTEQKETGEMLMPHPHAAPPQHRSAGTPGTWAKDHDLPLWGKGTNAPDSAGCSLTVGEMNFFTAAEYTSQCT